MKCIFSKKRLLTMMMFLLISLCTVTTASAQYPELSNKKLTMEIGDTKQLYFMILGGDSDYKLSYKSSNTKVVTVTNTGKVKAKKAGTAVITLKYQNSDRKGSRTCKVTVKKSSGTDVTAKYKSKLNKVLRKFDSLFGSGVYGYYYIWRFDDYMRTSMAYYAGWGKLYNASLSKQKRLLKTELKRYFGTSKIKVKNFTGYSFYNHPAYVIQKKEGRYQYVGGDWDVVRPRGTVKKVQKTKKGIYKVTYKIDWYDLVEDETYDKMGTYAIYLKKANTSWGFVINDIKITENLHKT